MVFLGLHLPLHVGRLRWTAVCSEPEVGRGPADSHDGASSAIPVLTIGPARLLSPTLQRPLDAVFGSKRVTMGSLSFFFFPLGSGRWSLTARAAADPSPGHCRVRHLQIS